jgi:hypothetical protein
MTAESKPFANSKAKSGWFAIARFLLLAAFVAGVFLLAMSMTQHRFCRGGRIDQRGVLTQ